MSREAAALSERDQIERLRRRWRAWRTHEQAHGLIDELANGRALLGSAATSASVSMILARWSTAGLTKSY